MKKLLLLSLLVLTACSGSESSTKNPVVQSYDDCVQAGGEVEYKAPHQCTFDETTYYDTTPVAKFVDYGPATGYYASPVKRGTYPAIILVHEWWGLNSDIWSYARDLAEQGYVVLAVDLYNGEVTTDSARAGELSASVHNDPETAMNNLKEAMHWLSLQYNVQKDDMGAIGWCFGGDWTYQMAKDNLGLKSAVVYYGRFDTNDDLSKTSTKILGHFGADDKVIAVDDVKVLQEHLAKTDTGSTIYIYPNESHAFARHLDSEDAKTAWDRTLKFLKDTLQ